MTSDLASTVWAAARRDIAAFAGQAATVHDDGLLWLSGGPTADFNMSLLEGAEVAADSEATLGEFMVRVRDAAVEAMFMWPSASNARLAPRAQDEGLTHVGAAPLMLLRSPGVSPAPRGFAVERVTDAAQLGAAADLIASAFGLDRGWVGRTFAAPSLLDAPTVRLLLATRNGEPYSTLTSTNASAPGLVGIWSMATAPDRQHQGGGRAILEAAIAQHRAEACYLVATESGKPLYDAVGFETIDELAIWVAGHSEQFH